MSDEPETYKSISCGLYSEYELAIMRRTKLRLSWVDSNGQTHIGTVMPVDLTTREHCEYLKCIDADTLEHLIRLDKILSSDVREAICR